MESVDENGGSRLVVNELGHIKELVRQLDVNLGGCPEHCKRLAAQIFAVTERSIGMIRAGHFDCRKHSAAGLDSPPFCATPSPMSDVSGMPFHTNKKKRKIMEKRKHQIRVSSEGGGAETPVDDGHSWRKYGQKDILGAKHPRGYYRCTHRKSQGCAATKQVQRADEDPALFDVIYQGEHTCVHKKVAAAAAAGHAAAAMAQPAEENPEARRLLQDLSTSLTVNTTSFCFSWQAASALTPQEHHPFSMPSTPENCFGQGGSLSTSLEPSPVTSDSNRFSMNPFQAEWRVQSEFEEVVSALVAAGTMPAAGMEMEEETAFSLDGFEFDVSSFLA